MPNLYTTQTKEDIRHRFINKFDELIENELAESYKEICKNLEITLESFNLLRNKGGVPTLKMLYNLQLVYNVPVDSILFERSHQIDLTTLKKQLATLHETLDQIDDTLSG